MGPPPLGPTFVAMILQGPLPSAVDAEEEKVPGDNINVFSYQTLRLYGAPAKMKFTIS